VKSPNPKQQIPGKLQSSNPKSHAQYVSLWSLEFGAYLGFGTWGLGFCPANG
jgi:hypothetical protein